MRNVVPPGCKVCGNVGANSTHVVREMMFGYRDTFEYLECSECSCLQIKEMPADLPKYYPLRDGRSYYENPEQSIFSQRDIQSFRSKAAALNAEQAGDQACFFLYKPLP